MTGEVVNGRNGCGARAGARTLNLLAAPLTPRTLRALSEGPRRQAELRREAGQPAQTTLRAQLRKLGEAGVLEKRRRDRFPGVLEYDLTVAGRELLSTMATLEDWLARSPEGPLELGSDPAKASVRALTEAWSTSMLRVLAARPITLTELDRVISAQNYPSLERRLSAMRLAGLAEARESDGPGKPYVASIWARQAAAPLLAAIRWERRHAPTATAPVGRLEVETLLLLATHLLVPPAEPGGSCRLAFELGDGDRPRLAGLLLTVREGEVISRTTRLEGHPEAWTSGSPSAWFAALIDRDPAALELGGDGALARSLLDCLHDALFGTRVAD